MNRSNNPNPLRTSPSKFAKIWLAPLIATVVAVICALYLPSYYDKNTQEGPEGDRDSESRMDRGSKGSIVHASTSPPDAAIVIVRDLAGNFEDCACTGLDAGGVPRLPAAALGAKSVRYLFIGRLVMPSFDSLRPDVIKAFPEVATSNIALLSELFAKLEHALWIPDEGEASDLEKLGVSTLPIAKWSSDGLVAWHGIELRHSHDTLSLNGQSIPSIESNSRTRRVTVAALWNVGGRGTPVFDHDLGFAYLNGVNDEQGMLFHAELLARFRGKQVVSYWATNVHDAMKVDAQLLAMLTSGRLNAMHGKPPSSHSNEEGLRQLYVAHGNCNACHPKAFETWKSSSHPHAYETLRMRGQESNPLCLNCHVHEVGKRTAQGITVKEAHAGITCATCHDRLGEGESKQARAIQTCVRCHTAETDPSSKYRAMIEKICAGDTLTQFGSCRRD